MRGAQSRRTAYASALGVCSILLAIIFILSKSHTHFKRRLLNAGDLSAVTRAELGIPPNWGLTKVREGNPWRTSRRGCGGRVRLSVTKGRRVYLRYAVWDDAGRVLDSTRNRTPVALLHGAGHASNVGGDDILTGLCAGDVISINNAVLAILAVDPHIEADVVVQQDLLADRVHPIAAARRHSCDSTCKHANMHCEHAAFAVVNDCDTLRNVFRCSTCEVAPSGAAGPDMPCFVSSHAPRGFRRAICLVAPHVASSTCAAAHTHTLRLCPCVM